MVISTPTYFGTRLSSSGSQLKQAIGALDSCGFSRLPEGGSPVPKHVGVDTYHVLHFKIGILLDFKECISWLIYQTRLIYAFLKFDVRVTVHP